MDVDIGKTFNLQDKTGRISTWLEYNKRLVVKTCISAWPSTSRWLVTAYKYGDAFKKNGTCYTFYWTILLVFRLITFFTYFCLSDTGWDSSLRSNCKDREFETSHCVLTVIVDVTALLSLKKNSKCLLLITRLLLDHTKSFHKHGKWESIFSRTMTLWLSTGEKKYSIRGAWSVAVAICSHYVAVKFKICTYKKQKNGSWHWKIKIKMILWRLAR